jgi:hypothetical protein
MATDDPTKPGAGSLVGVDSLPPGALTSVERPLGPLG